MHHIKKLFYVLAFCFFVMACSESNEGSVESGFVVKGKAPVAFKNSVLSIQELTNSGLITIDTDTVGNDGSFQFNGNIKEKVFCVVRLKNGDVLMVLDTNSRLELEIAPDSSLQYNLKGSKENDELKELYQMNGQFMQAVQQLETKYAQLGEEVPPVSVQEQIRFEYDSLRQNHLASMRNYISGLQHSIVPYFAINFLMPDEDFEYLSQIDLQLFKQFMDSKYAVQLHQKVEDLKRTATGAMAPDIVLNDPFGKNISLSALRGKVVLVDFWASWCKPCRDENPNVVKLYNKYKSKGFDVFGVSLDDNRSAWIDAINQDKLLWNHGSDLLKWNSAVVKQYSIDGIPFTVLVDKDGKILGKSLRGKDLENKLQEIYGF